MHDFTFSLYLYLYAVRVLCEHVYVGECVCVCQFVQNILVTLPKENKYPYESYVPGISKGKRKINGEKNPLFLFNIQFVYANRRMAHTYTLALARSLTLPFRLSEKGTTRMCYTNSVLFPFRMRTFCKQRAKL